MRKNKFLKKYLNSQSPSGWETASQKIWLNYIEKYSDKIYTDNYGTAVSVLKGKSNYKVVIEAHVDEIGWTVSHIDSKGYISVIENGGSDEIIAPGQRVKIIGDKGIINGVFGWIAIHERTDEKPDVKNLYVDIGAKSKKEVEKMGVHVGSTMTYDSKFTELKDYYLGKSLDNKLGGYIIANVAKKIKKSKKMLPYDLFIVNSVQEELGFFGAKMIAEKIKPDLAIITDVTHDTHSPMYDSRLCGDISCGKGPVIYYGPDVQRNLLKDIVKIAKRKKIKYQIGTYNESGTDTGAFFESNKGIPSCLISLPLKYMHTSVEMAMKKDVKKTTNLIYECLMSIKPNKDYRYIKC